MKNRASSAFLALAVLCLIVIGFVLVGGLSKKKPIISDKREKTNVLGQSTEKSSFDSLSDLGDKFEDKAYDTVNGVKDLVKEKAQEVEKDIIKKVENELSHLTQSQIDAFKKQICRDLGVISPIPTKNP